MKRELTQFIAKHLANEQVDTQPVTTFCAFTE